MISDDITLYVAAYKDAEYIPPERTVIGAGVCRPLETADLYDDSGDNIAQRNAFYSELTALYWIWKNDSSLYAGLEHYHRFFCNNTLIKPSPLTKDEVAGILDSHDIIIPSKHKVFKSVYSQYAKNHIKTDLDVCLGVIKKKCPEYCRDFFYVADGKYLSLYNMLITGRELLNEYCGWLFGILSELEGTIDLSGRDDYQKRVFGFIAERLFNVWLTHNKPKIFYADVYSCGDVPIMKKTRNFLLNIAKTFS